MAERKSFFKERTAREIRELEPRQVFSPRKLTERILGLGDSEALELRFEIIPGEFKINTETHNEASRKCYKHGELIALSQPKTQREAYESRRIPLEIRAEDFSKLTSKREEEISYIGYSFYPVQGNDRRKRIIPFVWCLEGARLFAYSESLQSPMQKGIEVATYDNAEKVALEGAKIICRVPSRTKKSPRYEIRMENVPVINSEERKAIAWGLKSSSGRDPPNKFYNMRYTWAEDREGSDVFAFYPQDIAAYIAIIKHYKKEHNLVPIEMSQFALPSKQEAEFYKRLCNNIVIFDPTLHSKNRLRKLHVAEKSILIARSISVLGHDNSMYWEPERDGKLKDYDWQQATYS